MNEGPVPPSGREGCTSFPDAGRQRRANPFLVLSVLGQVFPDFARFQALGHSGGGSLAELREPFGRASGALPGQRFHSELWGI